jgi:hypothetical protein
MSSENLIQNFLISGQALLRAPATIQFNQHTATKFNIMGEKIIFRNELASNEL